MAVNCGAVTQSLAEAELFGHQAGSFTGATESRAGWFEAANGGTLFLDEIGDLPTCAAGEAAARSCKNARWCAVSARAHRLPSTCGWSRPRTSTCPSAIAAGRFRADLFYRLNVVTVNLPPLRDRPGDVLPLARHFVCVYSQRLNVDAADAGASKRHTRCNVIHGREMFASSRTSSTPRCCWLRTARSTLET